MFSLLDIIWFKPLIYRHFQTEIFSEKKPTEMSV